MIHKITMQKYYFSSIPQKNFLQIEKKHTFVTNISSDMQRFLFFLFFLFFVFLRISGQPVEPILRLNSGFHTAAIRSISADAAGRYLLTASEDKTARLLDARTGNALRTFRPPIGYGAEGSLFACALSPDGAIAAVGGCTGATWNKADSFRISVGSWTGYARELKYSIYLFATSTGELLLNIDHLETEVQYLCFSPGGEHLAVALAGDKGVRIIRTADGAEVRKLIGYGGTVRQMAFSRSGQLASVADDKYLRLYNRTFQLMVTQPIEGKPSSVAFSADESTIAVGNGDLSRITLYHPTDGKTTSLTTPPNSFTVSVAFTADGTLYSGEYVPNGRNRIVAWKNGRRTEIPGGNGKITGIGSLPDGSVVYATSYPETGRILADHKPPPAWNGNGQETWLRTADMVASTQLQPEQFELNNDGSEVGLSGTNMAVLYFSLSDRELKTARSYLPKAAGSRQNVRVTGWKNGRDLNLNSKPLSILEKEEISRCVDISGDGKYILLGTNLNMICLDGQGHVVWKQSLSEESVAIRISGNGRLAVIAMSDGSYAWHDMTDGTRLLNLYVHPDHKRWILWTPAGFYDCSTGAEELIGWNLNQGKDKASAFFPVAQFRSSFYRPETIDQSVGVRYNMQYAQSGNAGNSSSEPVAKVVAEPPKAITQALPPEINILSPQPGSSANNRQVRVQYTVHSQTGKPVHSVKILVNGRPVQLLPSVNPGTNEVFVEIPESDCEISLIAQNEFASSVPAIVSLKWTGSKMEDLFKPKLYILAVGVSKYKDRNLTLQYAAKDATDFANIMMKQKGWLYGDVSVKLLTDDKSTKNNILDGLDWILAETTSRDVAMIFFAGHGMNDNVGNFYYLPVDADRDRLRATCVNSLEIQQSVSAVAGKVVLFMDACHSGGVMATGRRSAAPDIVGFINDLTSAENGVVVFTSSTGRQYSLEDPLWNNGAFTKAVVEGLAGKADLLQQRNVSIKTLDLYVNQRVKELTKGQQAPTIIVPGSISDFPVAVLGQ